MASQTPETFRFGEFELNVDAGELRRNNRRVKLQPQPFKLLVLLVRRAGNLVSRDEISGELWPDGTFVDFDQSVNFSIKQIRDVLGDSAERPLYLETVPRRGHRFIAPPPRAGRDTSRGRVPGATGSGSKRRSGPILPSCVSPKPAAAVTPSWPLPARRSGRGSRAVRLLR